MQDARVGDTITVRGQRAAQEALPGYAEAKPQVFCGLFPVDADDYQGLREALERLQLNDAALSFEPEVRPSGRVATVAPRSLRCVRLPLHAAWCCCTVLRGAAVWLQVSSAMGFGFRCGFLGMLHMDIVQERLEREHNLSLIMSAPTVVYRCTTTKGETTEVSNPAALPDVSVRQSIAEPFVKMEVITPSEYNGTLMELCQQRRGAPLRSSACLPAAPSRASTFLPAAALRASTCLPVAALRASSCLPAAPVRASTHRCMPASSACFS
jgi:GTP-binding protein LepA